MVNHYGMIGTEGMDTCRDCLNYLSRIWARAKRECHDCYYATEYGEPSLEPKRGFAPLEQIVVHRMSSMSAQEHDILEQLVRRVDWLKQKLLEREEKKPKKYQQYRLDKSAQ